MIQLYPTLKKYKSSKTNASLSKKISKFNEILTYLNSVDFDVYTEEDRNSPTFFNILADNTSFIRDKTRDKLLMFKKQKKWNNKKNKKRRNNEQ